MPDFTDQTGRIISINYFPKRIISLVPSQTELLFHLDMEHEVAGITKFCIHPPEWHLHKIKVGGTKNLNIELIHSLSPDLIIANKEENTKEQIEILQKNYPVWVSDVNNIISSCEMIEQIGEIVDKKEKSQQLSLKIKEGFNSLTLNKIISKTVYLIWQNPYMTVGSDTFIHSILEIAGFENVFKYKNRYPEISITDIQDANVELLLLSSEPYPFKEKHISALQKQLPDTKVLLVNGEMFSWYGSRLLLVPEYLQKLKNQIPAL